MPFIEGWVGRHNCHLFYTLLLMLHNGFGLCEVQSIWEEQSCRPSAKPVLGDRFAWRFSNLI